VTSIGDLAGLCDRIAGLFTDVDQSAPSGQISARTGAPYLPGLPALNETDFRDLLVRSWVAKHPTELKPPGSIRTEVPYPRLARARCDLVFSSSAWSGSQPEWAVELKRIQFVGDNGKNNDFNVQKMLSPYLKDRSLIHDIHRMREHPLASKHAVVAYCFSYNFNTCDEAQRRHPSETDRINNLREVCRRNDAMSGDLRCHDLIVATDGFLRGQGVVTDLATSDFIDIWRHPCGGGGTVFGWLVSNS
jgi:hypothetical protein